MFVRITTLGGVSQAMVAELRNELENLIRSKLTVRNGVVVIPPPTHDDRPTQKPGVYVQLTGVSERPTETINACMSEIVQLFVAIKAPDSDEPIGVHVECNEEGGYLTEDTNVH
jgi:hypothetical protein